MQTRLSFRRGFTLIELIVVIAVVMILAALAYPVYQRVVQSGRATGCLSNLRQISVGFSAYLQENNNTMPTMNGARASASDNVPVIDNTLNKYIPSAGVFACPADPIYAASTGTSYYWNVAMNGQAAANLNFLGNLTQNQTQQPTSQIPLLGDKEGFHPYLANKVNILYADGHVSTNISFFGTSN